MIIRSGNFLDQYSPKFGLEFWNFEMFTYGEPVLICFLLISSFWFESRQKCSEEKLQSMYRVHCSDAPPLKYISHLFIVSKCISPFLHHLSFTFNHPIIPKKILLEKNFITQDRSLGQPSGLLGSDLLFSSSSSSSSLIVSF